MTEVAQPLHINDDPMLWFLDWGTRHNEQVPKEPTPATVLVKMLPEDARFVVMREAAVHRYREHIAKGGTDATWPGVFLCAPPVGMSLEAARRIRHGRATQADLDLWRSLEPGSPYIDGFGDDS